MPKLIPLGTVVVYRDGKAFSVPPNGAAFDFTDTEVDEVKRGNPNKNMFNEAKEARVITVDDIVPILPTGSTTPEADKAKLLLESAADAKADAKAKADKAPTKAELAKANSGAKDDGDVL